MKPRRPWRAAPICTHARLCQVHRTDPSGWRVGGAMVKESGVCSRLASNQGSWRQLLQGQCAGLRANCHTSRSWVPGGGRKGREGEEKTAVSRFWVIKRTGIYPRALPSLHLEPSSRGTPVTFLRRGSSGLSRPRPTHAWVRVPMTHITSSPGRNEERRQACPMGGGQALVQALLTRSSYSVGGRPSGCGHTVLQHDSSVIAP